MSLYSIRDALQKSKLTLAFTGAGVSVESGIPDFRSSGGIWEKYPIEEYGTREAFEGNPERFWDFYLELARNFSSVEPNPAHRSLSDLEEKGFLSAVITQNVDGLHQRAGNRKVVQLHGAPDILGCVHCGKTFAEEVAKLRSAPRCPKCNEVLKPKVVLFGDPLPMDEWGKAWLLVQNCEVFFVVGTSDLVYPASDLPRLAYKSGATLCQFDLEPTSLTHEGIVSHFIEGPAGETLPKLMDLLNQG